MRRLNLCHQRPATANVEKDIVQNKELSLATQPAEEYNRKKKGAKDTLVVPDLLF
jgi:hypothetical protein